MENSKESGTGIYYVGSSHESYGMVIRKMPTWKMLHVGFLLLENNA